MVDFLNFLEGFSNLCIYIYYCMTGRAIQGNILFEIDRIGLTKGRDNTEVENGLVPMNFNNRFII